MIKKSNIVNGAYTELEISGININPSPEDVSLALTMADNKAAMLDIDIADTGWLQPDDYGQSDPSDDAGIEAWMVWPMQIVLADALASSFGKVFDYSKVKDAYRMMNKGLVTNETSKYPDTLPLGIANQDTYSPYFYGDNLPNDEC